MKRPEPIELENNLGPDAVTGEINRVPWMAYDVDEMDLYIAEKDAEIAELKKKLMPCLNGDCILTCEVVEKYGKENAELKQANKNLTESVAQLEQMKQKEVELDMKESRLKLQEKELKEKGVYINYWIDNEVEKPSKEYAGCNFAVTNGLQVLLAVWGGSKWFNNPFEYMRQNKITHWYRLPKLPENPKLNG